MDQIEKLEINNPNRAWVISELNKLHTEWLVWQKQVSEIKDQPYDRNTHAEVYADGEGMMKMHDVLQAKTLTFLNNNIKGHGFIRGFDGRGCDRTDLRLAIRVRHRIHSLEMLRASLPYALVPEGFWSQQAKKFVDQVRDKTGGALVDLATSWLKNPMQD
jgi:hypothetical protein